MQRLTRDSAEQLSTLFEKFLDKECDIRQDKCTQRSNVLGGKLYINGSNLRNWFTKPIKWKPGFVKDAIDLERLDIIRELLEDPDAHIDDTIHEDLTALQYAVQLNNHDIVQLLIDSGANINAKALISKDPPRLCGPDLRWRGSRIVS